MFDPRCERIDDPFAKGLDVARVHDVGHEDGEFVTAQARHERDISATFTATVPLTHAELNYTTDAGCWNDRVWQRIPATLTADTVTAELPEGTVAYYLNLFDGRECAVSTEHEVV